MTEQRKKKGESVGQTIGGMLVGFDQQIFRSTPPVNEMVAKANRLAPVPAAGGGTMSVGLPGDPAQPDAPVPPGDVEPSVTGPSASTDPKEAKRAEAQRKLALMQRLPSELKLRVATREISLEDAMREAGIQPDERDD